MSNKDDQKMPLYKIGVVSMRSGVPAPTLRVWEARHGTFEPIKTQGQHRLYSDDDVLRATLLKRLIDQGHAISNIARLATPALNALLLEQNTERRPLMQPGYGDDAVMVAIVGLALASRVESKKFTLTFQSNRVKVSDVFTDVGQALASEFQQAPDILLVKLNSLHATTPLDLHTIAAHCGAAQVIVLYNFGPEHVVESIKSAGMLARREPVSDAELSELIQAARPGPTQPHTGPVPLATQNRPRQYSEETLVRVAAMTSTVACECPRHVAEILSQLASFEQYSTECSNQSKEDAHLHAHLNLVAGSARALFERALEVIADHEGIELRKEEI